MSLRRSLAAGSAAAIIVACTSFGDAPTETPATPTPDGGGGDATVDAPSNEACTFFGGRPAACATPKHAAIDFANGYASGWTTAGAASIQPGAWCTPGVFHGEATVTNKQFANGGSVSTVMTGAFKSVRISYGLRGPKELFKDTYVELGCDVYLAASESVRTVMRLDIRDGGALNHSATVHTGTVNAPPAAPLLMLDSDQTSEERARFRKFEATYAWSSVGVDAVDATVSFDGQTVQSAKYALIAPVTSIIVTCGVNYADESDRVHAADIDDVVIDACE